MIIDILFTIGIVGFLWSSLKQLRKIFRTKNTDGLSLTHYYIKVIAISCMIIGYLLSKLPMSLIISLVELSINLISIHLIVRYRWGKFEWRKLLNFI